MNKTILLLFLFSISAVECKKAKEVADEVANKIIEGYWADVNGMVIQFKNNEATVVEFGSSRLGSNILIFNKSTHLYVKNLNRTSPNTWTGNIVVGIYDGVIWEDIQYVATTITQTTDSDNQIILSFTKSDFGAQTLTKLPATYTPPPPVNTPSCDTITHRYQHKTNMVTRLSGGGGSPVDSIEVTSKYDRPFMQPNSCNYVFSTRNTNAQSGTIAALESDIVFGEKPISNKTYTVVSGSYAHLYHVGTNEVAITYGGNYSSLGGETIQVTVNNGLINIKGTNIKLDVSLDLSVSYDINGY